MKGRIRHLAKDKFYGFIIVENDSNEYFFHKEDYKDDWKKLERDVTIEGIQVFVEFEPRESPKGWRADYVTRVSE
jgi:cold shock CspA family protein